MRGSGAEAVSSDVVDETAVERERTDLRLIPAGLAGWAAGWWAPLLSSTVAGLAIVTVAVVVATAFLWHRLHVASAPAGERSERGGWVWSTAAAAVVGAAVLAVAAMNSTRADASIVDELAAEQAIVSADLRITGDAQLAQSRAPGQPLWVLPAVVVSLTGRGQHTAASAPVVVLATDDAWSHLIPSTRVRVTARLAPNDRVSREVAVLRVARPPDLVTAPSTVQRAAEHLRAGLRLAVDDLAPDARGLLPGLVVGDESLMPPELVDDAKTTGLTHLTAVSGANVAIVLGVILGLSRWCGLRARAIPAAGAVALAGFVVLARPDPSVIRAAVMGVVVLLGLATGAGRRRMSALSAAVVVLLLIDPWLARSYGFALSVLASAAIVLLVPGWTERWSRFVPTPLATALAVPLAAQLVCAPVVVLLSDQVSLVAVLANLLAAPAVAPATVLGVLVAVIAPLAPSLAGLLAEVAAVPVTWIAGVARWCAHRPFAVIDWPGGASGALSLALVTIVAALLVPFVLRRAHLAVAAVVVAAVGLWGGQAYGPGWPPPGWQLVACDVGQGDALVLSVDTASAIVVDTGPDPEAIDGCLRDLGVRDVPLLIVTHPHLDHFGGVLGVLAGRHVGAIVTAPGGSLGSDTAELESAVRDSGATVQVVTAGWSVGVGPVRVEVLWPPADPRALSRLDPAESAENDASIVVRAIAPSGARMLLTGDIEPSAQRAILRSGVDLHAEILKVPHHGSRHQDAAFLNAVDAAVALVSVGENNDYGHPSPVTMDLLEAAGTQVFRTDTAGDLAVSGVPSRLRVAADQSALAGLTALDRSPDGVAGAWDAGQRWRPRAPPVTCARPSRRSC